MTPARIGFRGRARCEETATVVKAPGSDLYYEEHGSGVPILLIHPAGPTASTWGQVVDDLARFGRVISYDRRGYVRSGGEPVRSVATHTADAAALLDALQTPPIAAAGTSIAATIAIDLALRRPDFGDLRLATAGVPLGARCLPNRKHPRALGALR